MIPISLIGIVWLGALAGKFLSNYALLKKMLLTFSGAFLLTITFVEIFPVLYTQNQDGFLPVGIILFAGVFIQIVLESFTQGAEHGHFHAQRSSSIPWQVFIGLFVHAFLEGIPLQTGTLHHHHLLEAIVVHKFPIAMILYLFLEKSGLKKPTLWVLVLMFSMASPLGYLLGGRLSPDLQFYALALVAGIFLHISTVILFESSEGHQLKLKKALMLLLGAGVAYLSTLSH